MKQVRLFRAAGYNASADPSIDNFFASVAYRYGHSTINDVVLRLDETWSTHPIGHMTLRSAYYNPNEAMEAGIEPIIRGMLVQPQAKIEPRWSTAVSGAFMGDPAANGEQGCCVVASKHVPQNTAVAAGIACNRHT